MFYYEDCWRKISVHSEELLKQPLKQLLKNSLIESKLDICLFFYITIVDEKFQLVWSNS